MVSTDPGAVPHGVIPALLTPVRPGTQDLDLDALERLVRHARDGGVHGLSPCGSTGEGWRLTRPQRRAVVEQVIGSSAGLPVLPGVPVTALCEALSEIEDLAHLGARAALVAPPPGLPLTPEDLARLYLSLAEKSVLPLVLYDIPAVSHVGIPASLLGELAAHDRVAAIKDSTRDLEKLQEILRLVASNAPATTVLTGTDTLLVASLVSGAHGTIAASPGLFPDLALEIYARTRRGDVAGAMEIQRRLAAVVASCRRMTFPAGWKAAASLLGLCGPDRLWPAAPVPAHLRDRLRADLEDLEVLPAGS